MGHFQLVSCCPTGFLFVSSLHSLVWAIEQRWKSVESLTACCKQAPNSASARKALVWLQFLQRNLQRCAPSTLDFCWLTGSPCYAHWAILRSRWTYNPYNTFNITHLILNGLYFLFWTHIISKKTLSSAHNPQLGNLVNSGKIHQNSNKFGPHFILTSSLSMM